MAIRTLTAIAAVVVIAANPLPVSAEAPEQLRYVFYNFNCGQHVRDNPVQQDGNMLWALGYISGRNTHAMDGTGLTGAKARMTPDTASVWLLNYCQAHPFDAFVVAAEALRDELIRREQTMIRP